MKKFFSSFSGRVIMIVALTVLVIAGVGIVVTQARKDKKTSGEASDGSMIAKVVVSEEAGASEAMIAVEESEDESEATVLEESVESSAPEATEEPVADKKPKATIEPTPEPAATPTPQPTETPVATPEPTQAPSVTTAPAATSAPAETTVHEATSAPAASEELSELERYYKEKSTILKVINASESADVMTEAEVAVFLRDRGFDAYPVTYEFDMGGEDAKDAEITVESQEKRPMYETVYKATNGDFWRIYVINDAIMAYPVSFNLVSTKGAELLVSESEHLTSYDHDSNKFFVTIPNETEAIVKTVTKIDAETLNMLTSEEINEL